MLEKSVVVTTSGLSREKTDERKLLPEIQHVNYFPREHGKCNATIEPFHHDTWGATGGKKSFKKISIFFIFLINLYFKN